MPLDDAQEIFWRAISWPLGVEDYLSKASADDQALFARTFSSFGSLAAQPRMEIYANSYFWRLHSVLEENHPVVAWLVGADLFQNLCTDYVLEHPSQHADLAHFSETLPDFIESRGDLRAWAGLGEIARIEGRIGQLLHAPDIQTIDASALAQVAPEDWPQLTFASSPHLSLYQLPCDYVALDDARRADEAAPSASALPKDPPEGGVLVWRRGFIVRRRRLLGDEFAALQALAKGANFGSICALTAPDAPEQSPQDRALQVVNWLREWLSQELIQSIEVHA